MYSRNVEMTDNKFVKNWGGAAYGILLKDISDSSIRNNIFDYNTIGVLMEGCNRISFRQNLFKSNGTAIRIQANCENVSCQNNDFFSNSFDIETNGSAIAYSFTENYWDKYEGYDLDKNGFGDYSYRPVSLFSSVISRIPEAMMLFRSLTATLLDRIEKVFPTFTPENVQDTSPRMTPNLI
jgi:nitrous oxidase accessory protein